MAFLLRNIPKPIFHIIIGSNYLGIDKLLHASTLWVALEMQNTKTNTPEIKNTTSIDHILTYFQFEPISNDVLCHCFYVTVSQKSIKRRCLSYS